MRQRTAYGSSMPNLRIADLARYMGENWTLRYQKFARLKASVRCQRSDRNMIVSVVDITEVPDPPYIHQHGWNSKSELHHGKKRVASCKKLRFVAVFSDQSDSLFR
jgi:hypothetical protein